MQTLKSSQAPSPSLPENFLLAAKALDLQETQHKEGGPWLVTLTTQAASGLPEINFLVRTLTLPDGFSAIQLAGLFTKAPTQNLPGFLGALNSMALFGRYIGAPAGLGPVSFLCMATFPVTPELSVTWFMAMLRQYITDLTLAPRILQRHTLLQAEAPPQLNGSALDPPEPA